jgi:transcriptional regulator with XRE-family HTH domain
MSSLNIYAVFGRRLAIARREASLTQAELARKVGLSRASIANIEGGKQRVFLDQVFELAQAIGGDGLQSLLPDLAGNHTVPPAGMVLTGARNLSRQQEQVLAQILSSVGER